uniref:ubiquitinyl hydrolase 1 n=1 Tax=Canis lupus familiaris TaxID=9615 RepID=A0A8C0MZA9_CANLF
MKDIWETVKGQPAQEQGASATWGKGGPWPLQDLRGDGVADIHISFSDLQELSKRFTGIRKTKGDGNCFYRALGYSYLESLLGKSREVLKFKERVLQTPNDLLAAGFEEHKFRNFFNAFYSVVELVEKDGSVSSLLKVFNDQSSSDQIVQFLRLLTSAFIKNRADFFRHFIDEEMDIKDFCTHEVEPMAMECDHIQITALSQALNIALQGQNCLPLGRPFRILLLAPPEQRLKEAWDQEAVSPSPTQPGSRTQVIFEQWLGK